MPRPLNLLLFFSFLPCFVRWSTAQAQPSELDLLIGLKRSLGITNSTEGFDSWVPTNPPCKFSGVTCDASGRVTEINITSRGISGTLPFKSVCQLSRLARFSAASNYLYGRLTDDLRGCSGLLVLDLAKNALTGAVPDLSPLVKLQVLNLSNNGFSGSFPGYFLGNLTELTDLLLGDNPFDLSPFPTDVTRLTNLTRLYLSNCSLQGQIPPSIGLLTSLINLEFSDNYMSGPIPPEISKLINLWQLEMYNNGFTGPLPPGFGNLVNLIRFDASQNLLEGNLTEIRSLTKLVTLQLFNNNFSGEIPQELGDFKNLVNLSLYSNKLTGELPQRLGSWADFIFIDVSTNSLTGSIPPNMCKQGTMQKLLMLENKFTGGIPAEYGNCTTLTRFRVNVNSLSGEVPAGIWSLPNVNIIDLASNGFTGTIGAEIGNAKVLNQLYISGNRFSGEIPVEIGGATELVTIDAGLNELTGAIPATIGNLKKLTGLMLEENTLSSQIPSSLGNCTSLNEVNLAGNSLSGAIPATLGGLPVLNSLNLSNNYLSGEIPVSLSTLRLSSLDLSNNRLTGEVPPSFATDAFSQSFLGNPGLCSGNRVRFLRSCSSSSRMSPNRFRALVPCLLTVAAVLLASLGWFLYLRKRADSGKSDSMRSLNSKDSWDLKSFRVLTFDEQEIINGVTQENLIGKGGSGNVYRVGLGSGKVVAVKHIWNCPDFAGAGESGGRRGSTAAATLIRRGSSVSREFEAEVGTLSSIRHVNVVKLYCSITSEDSNLLVYEHMPNGSLWDRMHGADEGEEKGKCALEWETRYDVALGAARGLEYLHHGCERPILHRDVKSSNILLDESFKPRIADFGLAKMMQGVGLKDESTHFVAGTHGYIAPEYAYTSKISEKSDVYSFGVVLMELATGKRPIEPEFGENKDIVHWVCTRMASKEGSSLLDSRISAEYEEEAAKVLKVGVLCTMRLPSLRPWMRTVVQMLEDAGRWRMCAEPLPDDEKDQKVISFSDFVAKQGKGKASP